MRLVSSRELRFRCSWSQMAQTLTVRLCSLLSLQGIVLSQEEGCSGGECGGFSGRTGYFSARSINFSCHGRKKAFAECHVGARHYPGHLEKSSHRRHNWTFELLRPSAITFLSETAFTQLQDCRSGQILSLSVNWNYHRGLFWSDLMVSLNYDIFLL